MNYALTAEQEQIREAIARLCERCDGGYLLSGSKIWISTAQVAERMLILARTTPLEAVQKKTDGLSLFYTGIDRAKVEIRPIHKMGRHAVDSNMLFIDGLFIPEADRIGPEGDGFRSILHGMNPERILIAAEAAFTACETAVLTLGGMGYSAEFHVERYLREAMIPRLAPVSPHMILNFIAERVLGLPKSY